MPDPIEHPVLERLRSQQAPASHLLRMQGLLEIARDNPACVGMALVGSYAKGQGDRVSDLDLVAFVQDADARDFLRAADAVLDNGALLHRYGRDDGPQRAFSKLVYLDFASCELHVFRLPTTFVLRRPFVALSDPQGLLATLVGEGEPIRQEDFEPYPDGDDGLVWELVDCIKWLRRGRTELARDYLRRLGQRL